MSNRIFIVTFLLLAVVETVHAKEAYILSDKCVAQARAAAASTFVDGRSVRRPVGLETIDLGGDLVSVLGESLAELGSGDTAVEGQASKRLWYLGDLAVPVLVQGLQSENVRIREHSISILTSRGKVSVPYLNEVLLKHVDYLTRMNAATALGLSYRPEAVPVLIKALADENAGVVQTAIQALMKFRDAQAIDSLKNLMVDGNSNSSCRTLAAQALLLIDYKAGSLAVQSLVDKEITEKGESLFSTYREWERRELTFIPVELLDIFQLSIDAQTIAGESFGDAEVKQLLKYIDFPNKQLASACFRALGGLKVMPFVSECIERGAENQLEIGLFARVGSPEAIDYLIESIQSAEGPLRKRTLTALADQGGRWAVPILVDLLNDNSLRIQGSDTSPEQHQALVTLFGCLRQFGMEGHWINLATSWEYDVDLEIARVKDWWEVHGEDFLEGNVVLNPKLTAFLWVN